MNKENLIVTLNNEAKDAQGSRAGLYILAPNMVNEKKHWLQQGGIGAMWYCKNGFLAIGLQSNINEVECVPQLYAPGDSTGPETATGWKYLKDGGWHETSNDNDVLVELSNILLFINHKERYLNYVSTFLSIFDQISSLAH